MRTRTLAGLLVLLSALAGCSGLTDLFTIPPVSSPAPDASEPPVGPTDPEAAGDPWWGDTLLWHDEFDMASVDPQKWIFEVGGGGWGNSELQTYASSNATVAPVSGKSCLVITARKDSQGNWTSSRLKTDGLYSPTYGKIEARIKLPYGQGIWPAFWMLGSNIGAVGWPACGETDILEMVGGSVNPKSDSKAYSTLHWNAGVGYNPTQSTSNTYTLPAGKFADDFHTFGIIWTSTQIQWYVDGVLRGTNNTTVTSMGTTFQKPSFLILNLAVGGNWPGNPDGTTVAPQTMVIDWVRVYGN